jgi:hypothetical protein
MKFTYTPPAEQDNQKIPAGIYNAKCYSVTDGISSNNNPQVDLECQVETMKLRFRLVLKPETAWKVKQVRRAFGLVDPEGLVAECDTSEFVGKSGLCLVGYSKNLTKEGDPYRELLEFVEAGKEAVAETKLAQIIKAEEERKEAVKRARHFETDLENADSIPF